MDSLRGAICQDERTWGVANWTFPHKNGGILSWTPFSKMSSLVSNSRSAITKSPGSRSSRRLVSLISSLSDIQHGKWLQCTKRLKSSVKYYTFLSSSTLLEILNFAFQASPYRTSFSVPKQQSGLLLPLIVAGQNYNCCWAASRHSLRLHLL